MVFDNLKNAAQYHGLGPRFQAALEWMAQVDPATLPQGERVDIDGDNLFATYFELDTLPQGESKLEGHRNYADIQLLIAGRERVGYALAGTMEPVSEYTPDIQFFNGPWDTLSLRPGDFYIVWPQDLHAPRVADGIVGRVRRLVVKVKL